MSTYDRAMIEDAVRNGADITAAEAAALLADRDRLAAERNELLAGRAYKSGALLAERDALRVSRDQLGVAHDRAVDDLERLTARVRAAERILTDVVAAGSDTVGGSVEQALAALRGEQR